MTTEREDRIRKYVQSQAAQQALKARQEQEKQRNPFDVQEQIARPEPQEEKRGFFSKVLNALSFPGDVGMGLLTSAVKIPGIEEETERQIERGGPGTTKPVIERQRERRAELLGINPKTDPWGALQFTVKPTNWLDYAKATRKAYVEAREDKEYEFGIPLAGEILTDPTTYFGGYAIRGAVKGYKGAKTAVKGSTTYKTGASSLKPRKINDINSRLSKNSADSTPVPKTSTQIEKEVNAKNRGILNDFLFNSKFSAFIQSLH